MGILFALSPPDVTIGVFLSRLRKSGKKMVGLVQPYHDGSMGQRTYLEPQLSGGRWVPVQVGLVDDQKSGFRNDLTLQWKTGARP